MRLGDREMTITLDGEVPENAPMITALERAHVNRTPAIVCDGIKFAVAEARTTVEILPRQLFHTFTLRNVLDEESPDAP